MSRNWGGGNDYSGIFSGLAEADRSRIDTAVRRAAQQADQDKAAEDSDVYSKWKNGQITDEAWLAYLKTRIIDAGGDPEEQAKWKDMLREHTAAIADAQIETKFKQGKISAQTLLSHYSKRMKGVAQNSPAYRELADRYQQVIDYTQSGGGGGGGGGSGGKRAAKQAASEASAAAIAGSGPTGPAGLLRESGGLRYNAGGPDVIEPSSVFFGVGDLAHYEETLLADQKRIKDMLDQYKADSTLGEIRDNLSGGVVPVNHEMLQALDAQYLRNNDRLSSVYLAQEDTLKAADSQTDKGIFISTYMVDHNSDRLMPVYRDLVDSIIDRMKTVSNLDPSDALAVYSAIAKDIQNFEDGATNALGGVGLRATVGEIGTKGVTETVDDTRSAKSTKVRQTAMLPAEMRASGSLYQSTSGWKMMFQAILNPYLDPEARVAMADEALLLIPGRGDPRGQSADRANRDLAAEQEIRDLLYGNPNDEAFALKEGSRLGPGFRGAFTTLEQHDGLDNRDDTYEGARFVYHIDENGERKIVPAEAERMQDGRLRLTPMGETRSDLVQMAIRVGNKKVVAFATPRRIPNDRTPDMLVFQARTDMKVLKPGKSALSTNEDDYWLIKEEDYIPTAAIEALREDGLFGKASRLGEFEQVSPFFGVVVSEIDSKGRTHETVWFHDFTTNTLLDRLTPEIMEASKDGILVNEDGNPEINDMPYLNGSVMGQGPGISNNDMRRFISGRVNIGEIDLTEFEVRGAGTGITGDNPSLDDIVSLFAKETVPGRQGPHGRPPTSAGDRARANAANTAKMMTQVRKPGSEGNVLGQIDQADQIRAFSQKVGIDVGPGEITPFNAKPATVRGGMPATARGDAFEASASRESMAAVRTPLGLKPKPFRPPTESIDDTRSMAPIIGKPASLGKKPTPVAKAKPKPAPVKAKPKGKQLSRY